MATIFHCFKCNCIWKAEMKPKECPCCGSLEWHSTAKKISKQEVDDLIKKILFIHTKIIEISGGEQGIRDEGGLFHSIYSLLNYADKNSQEPTKVGAYIFAEFARKHHFMDGNKRTAYALAKTTMLSYRCNLKLRYKEAVDFIVEVAVHNSPLTLEEIKNWLNKYCEIIQPDKIETYINQTFHELIEGSNNGN